MKTPRGPVLEVRQLSKTFSLGDGRCTTALAGLTFSVSSGEFLSIVGPSGAGKTTLLNLIAQLDVASSGDIRLNGVSYSVTRRSLLRPGLGCRIGYVTQDDYLLPWRTAFENVCFPLRAQGKLTDRTKTDVYALLDAVGLGAHADHYPHELSGGMRKRVSLVRTLAYDPPVILMDEPFASVDPYTRTALQQDLLRLWSARHNTIVLVTHDIAEAIALGDRVVVLTESPARVRSEHRIDMPRPRMSWPCLDLMSLYREIDEQCRPHAKAPDATLEFEG